MLVGGPFWDPCEPGVPDRRTRSPGRSTLRIERLHGDARAQAWQRPGILKGVGAHMGDPGRGSSRLPRTLAHPNEGFDPTAPMSCGFSIPESWRMRILPRWSKVVDG